MLLGLQKINTDKDGVDRKIEMKMSKSKPNTAIFMTDSKAGDKEYGSSLLDFISIKREVLFFSFTL